MRRFTSLLLPVMMLIAWSLSSSPSLAQANERCFPETGQCIEGRLRAYWERQGELPVFGFPITEARSEFTPDQVYPYRTQWFERERFEAHPENRAPYDVLLGRLGDELLKRQGRDWFTFPKGQPKPGC